MSKNIQNIKKKSKLGKLFKPVPEPINTGCYTLAPEWKTAKTKQSAWAKGKDRGFDEGYKYSKEQFATEKAQFESHERAQRLDALKAISTAGSNIIESMARALLSYDKNL